MSFVTLSGFRPVKYTRALIAEFLGRRCSLYRTEAPELDLDERDQPELEELLEETDIVDRDEW